MRIRQAVILCGGSGKRLLPLTQNIPKPMVEVNNRPFLFLIMNQLSQQGVNDFLILTGYLDKKIIDYFGNGKQFGWKIEYSHGPLEWDTSKRIFEAKNKIKENFVLLYSDNYIDLNLKDLIKNFKLNKSIISLHIANKQQGNIKIIDDENGIIDYDNSRKKNDYNFVEVGYMLINKKRVFKYFKKINNTFNYNFSKILSILSKKNQISAIKIKGHYNSISDIKRLYKTRKFFKQKLILLLDRDGTINKKSKKGRYIENWNDFKFIKSSLNALIKLSKDNFEFIIITNQAGIARKMITKKKLDYIHKKMKDYLLTKGVKIKDILVSPDMWNTNSYTRKPAPGLFFEVSKKYNLNLKKCIYLGDDIRDCKAAYNAGSASIYLGDKVDLKNLAKEMYPIGVFKNMLQSINSIKKYYLNDNN